MIGRHYTPSPPWTLRCAYCSWSLVVFPRGAHGKDQGSGYEAGMALKRHVRREHEDGHRAT